MKELKLLLLFSLIIFISGCHDKESFEGKVIPLEYQKEEFNSILFAGVQRRNAVLYRYSLDTRKIIEIMNAPGEKLIELSHSPDHRSAFLLTAKKVSTKGILPFIGGINIYVINNDTIVDLVQDAGDAIQVFAKWETNNAFRIFINRMNPGNPSKISQTKQIFNTYGKLFEQEERSFDLLTEGYPQPAKEEPDLMSPYDRYNINIKSGETDSLFMVYRELNRTSFITSTNQKINRVSWSPDLMYSVIEILNNDTTNGISGSDLIVYSLKDDKIITEWKDNTPDTHFIINNLLITDKGRKNKSQIVIYDLDKREVTGHISMRGGCSLRTLLY